MPRRSREEQKAAQAELDRARRILDARAARIQRIQTTSLWPGILPRPSPSHRSWWEAGTCGIERTGHGEMRCCLLCRSPTNGAPHLLGRCCGFPGPRPEISMCSCHIHFGTRLQLGEWERGASAPEPVFGGAPASRTSRLRGCCPQIPLQSSGPPSFGLQRHELTALVRKVLASIHKEATCCIGGDFRFPRPPWYGRAARVPGHRSRSKDCRIIRPGALEIKDEDEATGPSGPSP